MTEEKLEKRGKPLHEYVYHVQWAYSIFRALPICGRCSLSRYRLNEHGRLLTSSMVDIYVGPQLTVWPLHKRLLCYHSPFFASIFSDKDVNTCFSQDTSYCLPEEDELTFELIV